MTAPTTPAAARPPPDLDAARRPAHVPKFGGGGAFFARLLHAAALPSRITVSTPRTLTRPAGPVTTASGSPPRGAHTHGHGDEKKKDKDEPALDSPDPLDPETRRLAQLAPPQARGDGEAGASLAPRASAFSGEVAPRARVSLEELLPQLVRRIAWAGDRQRGSAQLELGSGRHAGTVVTVHAEDGRVRVDVQGSDELRDRIGERLARCGIAVESVS